MSGKSGSGKSLGGGSQGHLPVFGSQLPFALPRPVPVRPAPLLLTPALRRPPPPQLILPPSVSAPIPTLPQRRPASSVATPPASVPERARSPKGTLYERDPSPPPGSRKRARREAAGFDNPSHSHSNMMPHWREAALSPIPFRRGSKEERKHLMAANRRFATKRPDGTSTGVIRGHGKGVLGHYPDAAVVWNSGAHKRVRAINAEHNRRTDTYHGIESREYSNASGASAPGYISPRPDLGSHPSYWNPQDPNFDPQVPWHTWHRVPAPTGSGSSSGGPGLGALFMTPVQSPQHPSPISTTASTPRPSFQLAPMLPPQGGPLPRQAMSSAPLFLMGLPPFAMTLPTSAPPQPLPLPFPNPFAAPSGIMPLPLPMPSSSLPPFQLPSPQLFAAPTRGPTTFLPSLPPPPPPKT